MSPTRIVEMHNSFRDGVLKGYQAWVTSGFREPRVSDATPEERARKASLFFGDLLHAQVRAFHPPSSLLYLPSSLLLPH